MNATNCLCNDGDMNGLMNGLMNGWSKDGSREITVKGRIPHRHVLQAPATLMIIVYKYYVRGATVVHGLMVREGQTPLHRQKESHLKPQ